MTNTDIIDEFVDILGKDPDDFTVGEWMDVLERVRWSEKGLHAEAIREADDLLKEKFSCAYLGFGKARNRRENLINFLKSGVEMKLNSK